MSVLRALLLSALLCLTTQTSAQTDRLTVPSVQERLATLGERKLPEAEHRTAQQALEQTLVHLDATGNDEQRLEDLQRRLENAPAAIAEARRELARLKAERETSARDGFEGEDITRLDARLEERRMRLDQWQRDLGEANTLIITSQTRPERAQTELGANQTRAQEIGSILKSGRDGNRALSAERSDQFTAELRALEARNRLRRQELAGNNLLIELGQAQRELLQERVGRVEREIQALQTAINERRHEQSEQTVAALSSEAPAASRGLLAQERATNLELSEYLLRTTEHLNEVTQRNLVTRRQLDNVSQADRALEEQISVLQGSRLLARILYEQRQSLPRFRIDTQLADRVADIRLYQFEVSQQRERMGDPAAYVERLQAEYPDELASEERRTALLDLLTVRGELLERLNRELNALLNESITLQINQRQLKVIADSLRATLEEQMFWIPSNRPLDAMWLNAMPGMLERQLAAIPWGAGIHEFRVGLQERPLLFLPLMLLIAALMWRRKWLYGKLSALHKDIGNVRSDSQLHTPKAILLNVLLALPGTLLLALLGLALQLDARGQNANLGAALIAMAQAWLVFYTVYRILSSGGVAERHFLWTRARVQFLHQKMRWLGLVVLILAGVVTFAERQPAALADDVIGVLVVLGCYASMTWLLGAILWRGPDSEGKSPFRSILGVAIALLPLALIGAVFAGYYFTALKLTDRLILTLFALILWRLLEALFVRGLAVAARRLAFQRALAKRQAAGRDGVDGVEVVEEPTLDMEQVNQQSLRLMRLALLGVFLGAMYWIWVDVVSLFTYLDNVTLYEYGSGSGDALTMIPISLGDVLGALVIVGVSLVLARNLPGLLEVLVLSRLSLAQGSAYATTTLLSYVIVGVGAVATLSTLGVSWDRLQWLVAALSVGLGFGLQEIFANFVSGLIILFERPMRIGDVVTVGDLSGTVSRIRIRATTIIDFDRKEIIVPNKTFVTGQLINWSLTDTVTRVTLRLGVGYGSDLEKVRELLLKIADENPRVLKDPEPLVFFLEFGDSTLGHELRIHVRELGDRNPAIDEINRRIDATFKEEGIEIAFRQMDVHIRSLAGLEHKLLTRSAPDEGEQAAAGTLPAPAGKTG